jgi:hypothetical protein
LHFTSVFQERTLNPFSLIDDKETTVGHVNNFLYRGPDFC